MNITIYEVFELNRVLHSLIKQQKSYDIKIAFKIHELVKWLDDTERFLIERMHLIFGDDININDNNEAYQAFLISQLPLTETDLKLIDLLNSEEIVKIDVGDVGILEKFLSKTED